MWSQGHASATGVVVWGWWMLRLGRENWGDLQSLCQKVLVLNLSNRDTLFVGFNIQSRDLGSCQNQHFP